MKIETTKSRKKAKTFDSGEKDNRKEHLIRTAIDLFAKKGFADTSIRDIAKTAKVNVALLYYYFTDKEEILNQIITRASTKLIVILKEIQQSEPDPLECLKKMINRQIRFAAESWKETKVLVMEADRLHGKNKTAVLALQREIYDVYMSQLIRLKEIDVIDDINLTVGNFAIFSMLNWFYRWFRQDGPLNEQEISEQMIRIMFYGFLKRQS